MLSPDGHDGSLKVYQDMELWRWALDAKEQANFAIKPHRKIWIQVVKGKVEINGIEATTSDGVAIWDESSLTIVAGEESEVLVFDLPPV